MIEGILDPNSGRGGRRWRRSWSAPLSNLGVHSGLGERAEEGSYRNTLILWAHFAGTLGARENSDEVAIGGKVIAQGLEGGIVAECMTGGAGRFNDKCIDPNLAQAI